MSRADQLRTQYETKIARVGQWIAIRRYSGVGTVRTPADTLTRAYLRYYSNSELIGTIVQGDLEAICLVDMLSPIMPVSTNDRLVTGFSGCDSPDTPPLTDSKVTSGKETAIKSIIKRTPCGVLIALQLHAVG